MGIVSCGTVLVSRLWQCRRTAWRWEDGAGALRPCRRAGSMRPPCRAVRVRGGSGTQPSLGSMRTVCHPTAVARRQHAQDYDESKRGGVKGNAQTVFVGSDSDSMTSPASISQVRRMDVLYRRCETSARGKCERGKRRQAAYPESATGHYPVIAYGHDLLEIW
jgi:hypothetical protein